MTPMTNPWIDPRVKLVRPEQARAYLLARGWTQRPFTRPQIQLFEGPLDDDRRPIPVAVPCAEAASDYADAVVHLVTSIAQIEDRYAVAVLNDILAAAPAPAPAANGTPRRARRSTRKRAAG